MIQASISSLPSVHGTVNFSQSDHDFVTDVTWPSSVNSSAGRCTVACAIATVPPAASKPCTESGPLVSACGARDPSAVSS